MLVLLSGLWLSRKKLNECLVILLWTSQNLSFFILSLPSTGMVATGASGTTTIRYGSMRENTLALECVLADENATLVKTGCHALKNSAGFDLTSLLCGSEGTLGIITSVTVKLHAIPDHIMAATCTFDSLLDAAQAVATIKLSEIPVTRCELLDSRSIEAFNSYNTTGTDLDVKPTIFLDFHAASESSLQEQANAVRSICRDRSIGAQLQFRSKLEDRKNLWAARHKLYYAVLALRPGSRSAFATDVCVPLSHFAGLIEATAKDVEAKGVVGPCFGHAGDGNFHCVLPMLDDDSEDYMNRIYEINDAIIRRTLAVGGTCTGEHGVGCGKIEYLEPQYGRGALVMMKAIKKALDPYNIMNPGKVLA